MLRRFTAIIRSLLNKPLFGTTVIPRDASVEPASFSDEEFPVHCPTCGYLLRGLPDGKCPECGNPFERGQLLVRQYVLEWQGTAWKHSAAGKWFWRFVLMGIAMPFLSSLAFFCMKYLVDWDSPTPPSSKTLDWVFGAGNVLAAVAFTSPLFHLVALGIAIKTYPRGARKRRRAVMLAIRRTEVGN